MLKVGLTGGFASGKTFVGQELERLGCRVIQADLLGHEVLAPGAEAYGSVVARFGNGVLQADGTISRPYLAGLVFKNPEELSALNAIVHPAVRRRENEIFEEIEQHEPDAIAVLEAAILIEAGAHERFDRLIVAYCAEELQVERALARDHGLSKHDVIARMRHQMPVEEKRKYADFVIDTSGEKEKTLQQTRAVYRQLRDCQNRKQA